MRYAIVIEKARNTYSAFAPDLPGCVASGDSVEAVTRAMGEAIAFHIDGLREDGLAIPKSSSQVAYVEVTA